MLMKDIKKAGPGTERRATHPEPVWQAALFEEAEVQAARAKSPPVGAAGTPPGGIALYARVSSEQQEKEETIASQLAAIRAYAEQKQIGLKEEDIYVDEGYSGKVLRRPALDRLLDRAFEGAYEQVLILNPFRLARNYGHQILLLEEFERAGAQVVFIQRPIGQGPDEELLLQMQGVIAQYEHAKIQERTRRGKLYRMRRGELVNGQRVFGYEYVSRKGDVPAHYEIIPSEAEVIGQVYRWYAYDGLSLRQIAFRLREAAVPTVRGGRWNGGHIGHMLRNSIYTGRGYANKIEAVEPKQKPNQPAYRKYLKSSRRARPPEQWLAFSAPVIVEEEIFELAGQRLNTNRQLASRHTKHDYLLRGLIRCECCQRKMYADTQSRSYMCSISRRVFAREYGHEPCGNRRRLPVGQLDELVWREVVKLLKKPALLKEHYPKLRDQIHPRAAGGNLEKLDAKIEEIQKQISRTNNLFIRGILDQGSHDTKYKDLKTTQQRLQTQREKLAVDHMDEEEVAELLGSFQSFARTVGSRLDTADFATRRGIVEQMVKCVIIGKSVITIEHVAPCKKHKLRTNLEP
jgi:site-specific DNA recombinase